MQYKVNFYNGLNSRSNSGKLFIRESSWLIEYKDSKGDTIHAFWLPQNIKPVENSGDRINLSYGSFPPSTLECNDPQLLNELDFHKGKKSFSGKLFRFIKKKGQKAVATLVAALLSLIVLIYFVILPFIAELMAGVMPAAYEERLGYYIADQFLLNYEVNYELSEALNEFSENINYEIEFKPEIIAVESELVNAFALPGGKIVVFDALLEKMNTEEQLAALLCHEVAHVKYRHSLKALFRNLGGYLFVSWLFTDLNAVTAIIIENAHSLQTLSYSRALEEEADMKALEILEKNNISQQGMVDLFRILKKEEESINISVSFLNTHPLTDERIKYSLQRAMDQTDYRKSEVLKKKWESIKELLN